jgi:Tol biopolymer transport system component
MKGIWRRVSSIGLVVVLMATLLMSFPLVSAPPPDKCEPWPECKDGGEEPPADPAIAFVGKQKVRGDTIDVVMVMNVDGSNQAVIYQEEYFSLTCGPSWSPDGNSIAWCGYTYIPNVPGWNFGVWRIDVVIVNGVPQGTNLQQLVDEGDGRYFSSIAWSPLGNEIAYTVHLYDPGMYKIDAVQATGGTPYSIYTAPEGHAIDIHAGLAWSSDGAQLATCGGEIPAGNEGKSIMIVDRATGTVAHRLLTGQFPFGGLDWARQGSNTLAFHANGAIYTVDIDSGTAVPVVEGSGPSWSPDNSEIAYRQLLGKPNAVDLSIYEFGTGDITPLAKGNQPDWRR